MARPIPLGVTGCGVVGKAGFEPAISRSRTGRDTSLRYFPKLTSSHGLSLAVAWSRTECTGEKLPSFCPVPCANW